MQTTGKFPIKTLGVLLLSLSVLFACQKEASLGPNGEIPAGKMKFSVYLLDGPYDFQQVLIDIKSIEVKVDTCKNDPWHDEDDDHDRDHHHDCDNEDHDSGYVNCYVWDTLDINPGVYDLLKLQNGVDTLLGSSFIPNGKIVKIKITLGDQNQVMVDSVLHPLNLLPNWSSVFIKIRHENIDSITSNNFQLYLDFDLQRSIVYYNGKYYLKPFLKPFGKKNTGEIEGKVRPVKSYGMIKAYNSTDTAFARPDHDEGEFKIRGLKEGTYDVWIEGKNGYKDSTITNVQVKRGRETELGTIRLHQ